MILYFSNKTPVVLRCYFSYPENSGEEGYDAPPSCDENNTHSDGEWMTRMRM